MKPIALLAAAALSICACGKSSPTAATPVAVAPATTSSSTSTTTTTVPATATACNTWANTQRASGLPPGHGDVQSQREALYAAGGGVKAVSNRYYAAWFPTGWSTSSPRRVMVGLHGTGGAPETEWSIDWKDIVSARNWAYVALKYVDDTTGVHDDDGTIYANLTRMLDDLKASCDFASPSMFLVGFSRGSAETFPVAYSDSKGRKFFKAFGNNSGAWDPSQPMVPLMEAIKARGETTAYSGVNFWMYCGALDSMNGFPMCDGMKNARTFITAYGGHIERLYEDPTGGHGGLAKNADAWQSMMSYFEGLR